MMRIHVFNSLNVSLVASVVYHLTRNASNCSRKTEQAVRRQAGMLREIAFVTTDKYRRAPTQRERENDIYDAENHLAWRSRRRIPRREQHQVDRDVDCVCVGEGHRITAHPPNANGIGQQKNSKDRP